MGPVYICSKQISFVTSATRIRNEGGWFQNDLCAGFIPSLLKEVEEPYIPYVPLQGPSLALSTSLTPLTRY